MFPESNPEPVKVWGTVLSLSVTFTLSPTAIVSVAGENLYGAMIEIACTTPVGTGLLADGFGLDERLGVGEGAGFVVTAGAAVLVRGTGAVGLALLPADEAAVGVAGAVGAVDDDGVTSEVGRAAGEVVLSALAVAGCPEEQAAVTTSAAVATIGRP